MEVLARPDRERLRFSDVARELDLTQATAQAIQDAWDRGWVSGDPADGAFSLGPALAVVAGHAALTRSLARIAHATAVELSIELGYRASVLERHADSLMITTHQGGDPSDAGGRPGERIPYAPPFGRRITLAARAIGA